MNKHDVLLEAVGQSLLWETCGSALAVELGKPVATLEIDRDKVTICAQCDHSTSDNDLVMWVIFKSGERVALCVDREACHARQPQKRMELPLPFARGGDTVRGECSHCGEICEAYQEPGLPDLDCYDLGLFPVAPDLSDPLYIKPRLACKGCLEIHKEWT